MRRVVRSLQAPEQGQIVEIGGLFFSSTITGVDPGTGRFSVEPERQILTAFSNLQALVAAAELSPDEIGLVRIAVPSADLRPHVAAPWLAMFPHDRPARRVEVYELPEGQCVNLQVTGVRGTRRQPLVGEGNAHPTLEPAGVRIGDLVFSSAISGIHPFTGRLAEAPRDQVRQAFRNMEALIQQAGGTMDDVAHVQISVRDRADNDDVLAAFLEAFPKDGNRAARKNVFDDQLAGDASVAQLQMIAVLGQGERQNYEVPGAAKRHPNPLGTRVGYLLFSAGIGGHDPAGREVERQAARALSNVRQLVEIAGGTLADVAHVAFTVDDYAHTPIILDAWRQFFPSPADEPARHVMAFGGRDGSYQIQVHIVAVLGATPAGVRPIP